MKEKPPAKPNWGTCPIVMKKNRQKYIATVCHGEAQILRDPESDVSMHIPKGSTGVFWKSVHTDYSKFKDNIPDEECLISPLVEIHHHDASDDVDLADREKFVITIPLCIPNKELWKLVKVRKWNRIKNRIISKELIQKDVTGGEGDYFVMEERLITVVTKHFCVLGGTINKRESCCNTLRIILVAKLEAREWKNLTTVKIKSFLCSRLLSLDDFRRVRNSELLTFFLIVLHSLADLLSKYFFTYFHFLRNKRRKYFNFLLHRISCTTRNHWV